MFIKAGPTSFNQDKLLESLKAYKKPQATSKTSTTKPKLSSEGKTLKRPKKADLPKELDPAFDRQEVLYRLIDYLHPQLELLEDEQRKQACIDIVRAANEIKDIYLILDHYTKHGQILPNNYTAKVARSQEPEEAVELMRIRNRYRSYISRHKKNPSKAEQIAFWKQEIKRIEIKLSEHAV